MAGVVGGNYMECEALLFLFRFVCVVSGSGVLIVEGVEELVLGFFKKLGELFGAVG
jgi:hypothetical protein